MKLSSISRRHLLGVAVIGAALTFPTLAKRVGNNAGDALSLGEQQRSALTGLPLLRGEPLVPADLEGKPVVVSFFASWCPPCRAEFDRLNALQMRHAESGIAILGVNIFEERAGAGADARLAAFLDAKLPRFRILANGESVAPLFNNVLYLPTLYVFGRDGGTVFRFVPRNGDNQPLPSDELLEDVVQAAL